MTSNITDHQIFQQWEEDQYDFHTYCMRKSTIQSYLKFVNRRTRPKSIFLIPLSPTTAIKLARLDPNIDVLYACYLI